MADNSKMIAPMRKESAAKKKQPLKSAGGGVVPKLPAKAKKGDTPQLKPGSEMHPKEVSIRFTLHQNPTLTLACVSVDTPPLFSLDTVAGLTGVHPEMLRYYWRAGLIDALHSLSEIELFFEESALHEIRRIEHYRHHLAVSRRALPLICELRREAERQHIEIQFLRYP